MKSPFLSAVTENMRMKFYAKKTLYSGFGSKITKVSYQ